MKRFGDIKYILDKEYRYYPEGCKLEYFTKRLDLHFSCDLEPTKKMRNFNVEFDLKDYKIKGLSANGIRIVNKNIIKIKAEKVDSNDLSDEVTEEITEEAIIIDETLPLVIEKPEDKTKTEGKPKKIQPDLFDDLDEK